MIIYDRFLKYYKETTKIWDSYGAPLAVLWDPCVMSVVYKVVISWVSCVFESKPRSSKRKWL